MICRKKEILIASVTDSLCVDLPASRSQKFQSTGGAPWQVYKSEQFFEAASGFELSLFLCPNILMEGAAARAEEGPLASFPVNPDIVAPEPAAAPSAFSIAASEAGEAPNAPAAADDSDESDEEIVGDMGPADLAPAAADAGDMAAAAPAAPILPAPAPAPAAPALPVPAPGPAHGLPAVVDLDALKMRRASLKRDLKECAKRVKREETC